MNNQDNIINNQTQFSNESLVFEETTKIPTSEKEMSEVSFIKTKKGILVIAIAVLVFLFLIITTLIILKPKENAVILEEEAQENQIMIDSSPLKQKINDLKLQLNQADPTRQSLSFPPVNMNIKIIE